MKSSPLLGGLLAVIPIAGLPFAMSVPRRGPDHGSTLANTGAKPTYAGEVAKILNERCVNCHRPGEVGPFSLVGYQNAKKWSAMVAQVSEQRLMPPWKAAPGYGEFKHENRLTDSEIATLKAWHEAGAPRGDVRREPATPKFSSEWTLGAPDMIIGPTKPFRLGAEGSDVYRNFVLKTTFDKPVWVRAIDVRPGNAKVVHHVIAFLDKGAQAAALESRQRDGQEGYVSAGGGVGFLPSGSLGGWAPGVRAMEAPDGTAFRVDPGTTIVLQVHYHKSGKEELDQTKLGLYFAKAPVTREMNLHWMFNFAINIAPGMKEHRMSRTFVYPQDETIYTVMPHMHLLGKSMKSWLEFPDGTTRPLVNVDRWDFNWQLVYALKEPIRVPKGTKQHIEAVYDNSASNPNNPHNPPKVVRWGEETTDEMFLMITTYTVDAERR